MRIAAPRRWNDGRSVINPFKKSHYHFPLRFSAHLISVERHLDDLDRIEQACFPAALRDARSDLAAFFAEELATGLILCEDGRPIGYASGIHICEENSADLLARDEFIRANKDYIFYATNVSIVPDHRSIPALEFLAHEMVTLLKSINYRYVTTHARKKTGLSRVAERRYGARVLKTYADWNNYGEPFDYLLFDLAEVPVLPTAIDYALTTARRMRCWAKRIPWYG